MQREERGLPRRERPSEQARPSSRAVRARGSAGATASPNLASPQQLVLDRMAAVVDRLGIDVPERDETRPAPAP